MIEIKHLFKTYEGAQGGTDALRDVSLRIEDGEIYGIIGMSGAGKSTLVRCINLLERPTMGEVLIDGCNIATLPDRELREKRRKITMIFQGFNLLMQRNCLKNVCFPLELSGMKRAEAVKRATELLGMVGLADKLKSYPAELSGGQQQRVAIARALATDPEILLCDEATSALDPTTTQSILSLIREIHDRLGITVVVITHQMSVGEQICTRVAILDNGTVAEEGPVSEVFAAPKSAAARALVFPEGLEEIHFSPASGERVLRIVFCGAAATRTPLIAQMAMELGIPASILAASTRSIGERIYGNMLLGIPGGEAEFRRATDYLSAIPDIRVEEVKCGE